MSDFFSDIFSPLLCGFRKGFSTQHSIFRLLQKWQNALDNKKVIGTILMDLSKAYDCIPHDLLLAKLSAYGFSDKSLVFIKSYLSSRKQRVKIGSEFSEWLNILIGVPQGSILGPLLYNFSLNDIFLFVKNSELCNFADDNTLYACDVSFEKVISRLTQDVTRLQDWFKVNSMLANSKKFQVMFLGSGEIPQSINIFGNEIPVQTEVKLLGIILDNKLSFSSHIKDLCNKANNKLSCLFRLRKQLSTEQTRTLINSYVLSYFLYCPLIWMFCNKTKYGRIQKVHKRALRLLYFDFSSSYTELLLKEDTITIHNKHLLILMTETYKSINRLNPEIMWNVFETVNIPYNLRNGLILKLPSSKTSTFGLYSLTFRAALLWNSIPDYIKNSSSISQFKTLLKNWNNLKCSCKICRPQ